MKVNDIISGSKFDVAFTNGTVVTGGGTATGSVAQGLCFGGSGGVVVNTIVTSSNNVVKKRVEITNIPADYIIDYVDLGGYALPKGQAIKWTPAPKKRVNVPPYIMSLGQPIYVGGVFAALEHPTSDNKVVKGVARHRLYIGKHFDSYVTPDLIVGAGAGDTFEDARQAFFEYIESYRKPKLRVQYNSWYDNMLDITEENLSASFKGIAAGFQNVGYRFLDSYVADDGWVDYKNGFWAFNEKFPDGFNKVAALAESLGGHFGVWFGPRGGYTQETPYSKILEAEHGYFACKESRDICTASPKYINALTKRMIDFVKRWKINYLKLDGFAACPCKDKSHGHVNGGYEDMYFYTELWENWCAAFDKIRAVEPNIFLNLTSYSHPSAFFLKHVDSVWLNNSSDMWFEGAGGDLEQCLNYRDGRYYDLYRERGIEFPPANLYNHEPCYGNRNFNLSAKVKRGQKRMPVTYTDKQFKDYMYMCVMRGQALNELYFSAEMLSESKFRIAAAALEFAEKNYDIIKNSRLVCKSRPQKDVYAYVARGKSGTAAIMRNPRVKPRKFILDGQTYTLSPHEIRLITR